MKKTITVVNSKGLHARPATVLAETAAAFDGEIRISFGRKTVSGKSLIALLSLAVPQGGEVILSIEGEGAAEMLEKIADILGINYD